MLRRWGEGGGLAQSAFHGGIKEGVTRGLGEFGFQQFSIGGDADEGGGFEGIALVFGDGGRHVIVAAYGHREQAEIAFSLLDGRVPHRVTIGLSLEGGVGGF